MKYDIANMAKVLGLVAGIVQEDLDKLPEGSGDKITFEVFPVFYAYILGGFKATVASTLADSCYYEVTYNKEKDEFYIDVYVKVNNIVVSDSTLKAPLN